MLINFIENYIRKTRNKDFHFDENLSSLELLEFLCMMSLSLLRANIRLLIHLQKNRLWFFEKNITIFNFKKLTAGENFRVGEGVRFNCSGNKGVIFGRNCNVGSYSRLMVSSGLGQLGAHIIIGNNVGIGSFSNIGGTGGVMIGDDTIIGPYLSVHTENHNFENNEVVIRLQGVQRQSVVIGRNCWLGGKVTVLAGVSIGDGAIIAAGSIVNKDVPPNSIVGGVPAKIIRKNKYEKKL